MGLRICPGEILFVDLHDETTACGEIENVVRQIQDQIENDVAVEFENVTVRTLRSLTPLMYLRALLHSGAGACYSVPSVKLTGESSPSPGWIALSRLSTTGALLWRSRRE